jgi:hypothetical protein
MVEFILKFRIQISKKDVAKKGWKKYLCASRDSKKELKYKIPSHLHTFRREQKSNKKKRVWFLLVFPFIYSQ